jgi:hypothetical protein
MTEEQLNKICLLGQLGFAPEHCAIVLGLKVHDAQKLITDLNNPATDAAQAYNDGEVLQRFQLDSQLYKFAQTGDVKAIELFEKRRAQNKNSTKFN